MNSRHALSTLTLAFALAGLAGAQDAPAPHRPSSEVTDAEVVVLQLRRDFRVPTVKGSDVEGLLQRDHGLFAAAFTEVVEEGGARPLRVGARPDEMHDRFESPGTGTEYGVVGSVHLNVLSKDDGRTIRGGLTHLATVHVYLYSKGRQTQRQGFWGPYLETEFDRDEDSAPIAAVWFADAHPGDVLRYLRGLRDGSLMLSPVTSPTTWASTDANGSLPATPGSALAAQPFGLPLS